MIAADAGPLLHLYWVGAQPWALPLEPIDVVSEVWEEVLGHDPAALREPRLRRVEAGPSASELSRWALHSGERATLSYALSRAATGPCLVLCDERIARLVCVDIGLPMIGSVGLILEAFRAGRVETERACAALSEPPGAGRFHIRAEILSQAIAAVRAGG